MPASPPTQPTPPRPPRDVRRDIVRGWLQLTIYMSHATGSFIGGWMIFGSWGLSDSSEQFVLLSGFTLGSVFARKASRDGWRAGAADLLRRTWRLYRIHLTVFVLFGLMIVWADARLFPGELNDQGWGFAVRHPLHALPGVLTMLYQPRYMGILPTFVWCMLLLPGFALLEHRVGAAALLLPLASYAGVWLFGWAAPSLGPDTGIGFNPFAWQILYLLGAWLGRRALLFGRALPYASPVGRAVTATAILVVLAGIALRLGWYGFVPWHAPVRETSWVVGKEDLAVPRLLHALALAWLVAALVPREAPWMHAVIPRVLAAIGRHSLEVFCLGLFLSWGAAAVFRLLPGAPLILLDPALIVAGSALLGLWAMWLDRRRLAAAIPARA